MGCVPSGWHVPTDVEYTTLTDGLGGTSVAGGKMKSSPEDSPAWNGTNTSGFSGLAGGYRTLWGLQHGGNGGYFWSASADGYERLVRVLEWWYTEVDRYNNLPRERFFSSLRSGLKTRACGGLDPLILCPFGPFVLTLVFSVRPPQSGVECGEVGCSSVPL